VSSYLSGPLLRSFSMRSFTFFAFAAAIARSVCNGMARAAPMMGAVVGALPSTADSASPC